MSKIELRIPVGADDLGVVYEVLGDRVFQIRELSRREAQKWRQQAAKAERTERRSGGSGV